MHTDLNTPEVLVIFEQFIDSIEQTGLQASREPLEDFLHLIDNLLGLRLLQVPDITEAQKALIAEREQARLDKNWTAADRLRDKLGDQNIGLRDSERGPIWYRFAP